MQTRCNFDSLERLEKEFRTTGAQIPLSADISILSQKIAVGNSVLKNRLAIQPMEGNDACDGAPGELTRRRYLRYSQGGAGLIWFEALAVSESGRAGSGQMLAQESSIDALSEIVNFCDTYNVVQLTHSGRYSKREGLSSPLTAYHSEVLDRNGVELSDDELKKLRREFVNAAKIAKKCGFDCVDIKSCHGYLLSELLSARNRTGQYGGRLSGRTKLHFEIIDEIKQSVDIDVAVRLNVYDGYNCGFGVDVKGNPDFSEPIEFCEKLEKSGVCLLNITCGNPYFNPHVTRPFAKGAYIPDVEPLLGVSTLLGAAKIIKSNVSIPVVGSGFSWLSQYGANVAAGGISGEWFDIAGFGRQAFAYPDFASDILDIGKMNSAKCCTACSACSTLLRSNCETGCVVRDKEVYLEKFRNIESKREM